MIAGQPWRVVSALRLSGTALTQLCLIYLEQPFDIAGHDQAKIFDLELQMALRVFDDFFDFPLHRVERMIGAV